MKKLFLFAAFAVFGLTSMNAQGDFRAGLSGGIPIGDAGDLATFAIAVDLGYLFEISDDVDAGPTVGYTQLFGDSEVTDEDFGWLPVGGAIRFHASEDFTVGADVGYAVGMSPSDIDGGLYYRPRVQYGVSEKIDVVLSYTGISLDGVSFNTVTLGVDIGL